MKVLNGVLALALLGSALSAFADKPAATKVLADAQAKARAEKKNVLVTFDASW